MADEPTDPGTDPEQPTAPTPAAGEPQPLDQPVENPANPPAQDPDPTPDPDAADKIQAARDRVDEAVADRLNADPNEEFKKNPSVVDGVPVDNRPGR